MRLPNLVVVALVLAMGAAALPAQSVSVATRVTSRGGPASRPQAMLTGAQRGAPFLPLFGHHDNSPDYYATLTTGQYASGTGLIRNPVITVTGAGTAIEVVEIRHGQQDYQIGQFYARRLTRGATEWGAPVKVADYSAYDSNVTWLNAGALGTNTATGRVHWVFTRTATISATVYYRMYWTYSDDDGITWAAPAEITASTVKYDNTHFVANGTGNTQGPATTIPTYATAGADSLNSQWQMVIAGPGTMTELSGHRLVTWCYHRYTSGGSSYPHCIYTDDDGATWNLGGGYEETTNTRGGNETCAVLMDDGNILLSHRDVATATNRRQLTLAPASLTGTWATSLATATSNGSTPIVVTGSSGSMVQAPDGALYLAVPTQVFTVGAVARSGRLAIYKSTDRGATWPTSKVLHYGGARYSTLRMVSPSRLECVFEGTTNDLWSSSDQGDGNPYQNILRREFSTAWVTSSTPAEFYYPLNEGSAGAAIETAPGSVWDHGNRKGLSYQQNGRGHEGGTYTATGFQTDGTRAGLILQDPYASSTYGGPLDPGADSWTIEIADLVLPSSFTAKTIFSSRSTAGVSITSGAGGSASRLIFTVNDGTDQAATVVTSASAITDQLPHDVRAEWDATAKTAKLFVDGVQHGTTATNASVDAVVGGAATALGGAPALNDSGGIVLSASAIRITRGIRASGDYLTGNETKNAPLKAATGLTTAAVPSGFPKGDDETTARDKCVLALNCTYDGGQYMRLGSGVRVLPTVTAAASGTGSAIRLTTGTTSHSVSTGDFVYVSGVGGVSAATGFWLATRVSNVAIELQGSTFSGTYTSGGTIYAYSGGSDYGIPLSAGRGFDTARNAAYPSEAWATGWGPTVTRNLFYTTDADCGGIFRHSYTGTGPAGGVLIGRQKILGTRYDFIQNTGSFVWCGVVKFKTDTGTSQFIWDNSTDGATPGMSIYRTTGTNRIGTRITRSGPANQVNDSTNGPTIANGVPTFLAVVGRGDAEINWYTATISAGSAAALSTFTSSGEAWSLGTYASTADTFFGSRNDATRDADLSTKNVHLYNSSSTTSGNVGSVTWLQSLAEYFAQN